MPLPKSKNLPVVDEANASEEVAQLYAKFRETFGRPNVPGILKCFATHPPLLEHMMWLAETVLFCDGSLGRANKELIATFVSSQNQCDDGTSFAYKRGEFLRTSFSCQSSEDHCEINIHIGKPEGSYPAWWKEIAIQVNGLSVRPSSVTVNGKSANFSYADASTTIVATDSGDGIDVMVKSIAISSTASTVINRARVSSHSHAI